MKRINGFEKASAYTERERLPIGGYILKILDIKYVTYTWGEQIVMSFDIIEGDYKDFFTKDYRSQTGEDKKWRGTYRLRVPSDSDENDWTLRRFKTTINAFEDSNPRFHWDWDEGKLKGLIVGGVFNNKEYEIEGRTGFYTNCHHLTSIDAIRNDKFKIPADTLLKNKSSASESSGATESEPPWMNIPETDEDELPFD